MRVVDGIIGLALITLTVFVGLLTVPEIGRTFGRGDDLSKEPLTYVFLVLWGAAGCRLLTYALGWA